MSVLYMVSSAVRRRSGARDAAAWSGRAGALLAAVAGMVALVLAEAALGPVRTAVAVGALCLVALLALRTTATLAVTLGVAACFANGLSFSTLLKGVRFLDVAVVVALAAALSLGRLRGRRASPVMDLAFALFGYALAIAAARGLLNAAQRSQALIEIRRLAPLALYLPATVVMPARSSRRLIWWGFVVGCTAAGVWEVGSAITHNVRQLDLGLPIYAGDRKA